MILLWCGLDGLVIGVRRSYRTWEAESDARIRRHYGATDYGVGVCPCRLMGAIWSSFGGWFEVLADLDRRLLSGDVGMFSEDRPGGTSDICSMEDDGSETSLEEPESSSSRQWVGSLPGCICDILQYCRHSVSPH